MPCVLCKVLNVGSGANLLIFLVRAVTCLAAHFTYVLTVHSTNFLNTCADVVLKRHPAQSGLLVRCMINVLSRFAGSFDCM